APETGRPVFSDKTWPTTAPSLATGNEAVDCDRLPTRSMASATIVSTSPGAAPIGAEISRSYGGAVNVWTNAPLTDTVTRSTTRLSVATTLAAVGFARVTLAPTVSEID